jgi:hypothetical protein
MTTRGRKPGFSMSDEHRVKIRNSNILNALIEHVEGLREMSATQVSAGLGLLKKVMPDLAAAADMGEDGDLKPLTRMTNAELEAIAAGRGEGAAAPQEGARKLN